MRSGLRSGLRSGHFKKMDPKKWGPTVWWFLQWMAHQVDSTIISMRQQGYVNKTATILQTKMLKDFTQFVNVLSEHLLPCRSCQESTRVFLRHLSSRNVMRQFAQTAVPLASEWIFGLHNMVNMKLKKPTWTLDQLYNMRQSSDFQDFPVAQNVGFIEKCIQYCLSTKWPHKRRKFVQAFREFLSQLLWILYSHSPVLSKSQQTHLLQLIRRYSSFM